MTPRQIATFLLAGAVLAAGTADAATRHRYRHRAHTTAYRSAPAAPGPAQPAVGAAPAQPGPGTAPGAALSEPPATTR